MSLKSIISGKNVMLAVAVGLFCAGSAFGDVARPGQSGDAAPAVKEDVAPGGGVAGGCGEWWDMFDTYLNGQLLDGTPDDGGWQGWDNDPQFFGTVTDNQWWSLPHSVDINGNSDLIHQYCGVTSGQWVYKAYQYIPTGFAGQTWFILQNIYNDGGPYNWSVQVRFNSATGMMESDFDGATMPYVTGVWIQIIVTIDLDADLQSFFYDGNLLYTKSWTEGVGATGILAVGSVDLFAQGASTVYYDDLHLELAGCEPVAEDCSNGVDDDCDELVDCDDPDCLGVLPEACNDGIDNDCDGVADCDDADCDNDPACLPVPCACCLDEFNCVQLLDFDCADAGGVCHPNQECTPEICAAIPTVSEWGMIALTVLLLVGAGVVMRKRGIATS